MTKDNRGTRPPRPRSGASGTPGSIGKELGGDLDFEPDALLDSLMQEDPPAPPARRPAADSQPPIEAELSAAELESVPPGPGEGETGDRETLRPSYSDDEVTLVGHRDMLFQSGLASEPLPPHAPAPPPRAQMPAGPDSTTKTPIVQRPPPTLQSIPGRQRPGQPDLRPPPAVPRPGSGPMVSARPAVPRPGPSPSPLPPAFDAREPMLSETAISTAPPPPLTSLDDDEDEAPESQRTSLTDDEIAALDELESLSPPSASEPPTQSGYVPPPGTLPNIPPSQPVSVSVGQATSSIPASALASSRPPRSLSSPPRPRSQAPRSSQIPRSGIGASLPEPGHPEEWTQRAE